MAIKLKALERNVSFEKGIEKWAFVLQPELYSQLSAQKVMLEAALRSGINRGAITAAWDAIGAVVRAWATEGHSVAVPGLGTMRFGVRAQSVDRVELVGPELIRGRRVIFTPSMEIKDELARTDITITCYDRHGNIIKQVASQDPGVVDPTPGTQYTLTATAANPAMGSVTGAGTFAAGTQVTIEAKPQPGHSFVKWSDGNATNPRVMTLQNDLTLTAEFRKDEGPAGPTSYTLTATAANPAMGSVTGAGTFAAGTQVTIEAKPQPGHSFVKWSDGNATNPRTLALQNDLTLTAEFRKDDTGGGGSGGGLAG